MAAPGRVAVLVELVAYDTGHWCTRCNLPSGARAYVVLSHGIHAHMQVRLWCDECDSGDFVTVEA